MCSFSSNPFLLKSRAAVERELTRRKGNQEIVAGFTVFSGDISVSTAKPEVISDSVEIVSKINSDIAVLCGAGVKNQDDISKAISLGSQGILLASGVVKSTEPRKVLLDLIKGL